VTHAISFYRRNVAALEEVGGERRDEFKTAGYAAGVSQWRTADLLAERGRFKA
jgi:hypothetical protein